MSTFALPLSVAVLSTVHFAVMLRAVWLHNTS